MSSPKIIIYTKRPCPYCDAAKAFFHSRNWPYEERDLTGQFDEMSALKERTGHMTFPQIYFNDEFVGGYDDMMERERDGRLTAE